MNFAEALPKGFELHGYRIEKTLGGGGFSIVYLATDMKTEARVAIKEYLPADQARRLEDASVESISGESTSNTFRKGLKRFFDEAAALAKVDHPNIVRVTDFFRANNTVYLVMHYERGKDLRTYIKRHSVHSPRIPTVAPRAMGVTQKQFATPRYKTSEYLSAAGRQATIARFWRCSTCGKGQ
jgi:serine/threonine protein kinase